MAFFGTANGSFPERFAKNFDFIISEVTKANQFQVLGKKKIRKQKEFISRKNQF